MSALSDADNVTRDADGNIVVTQPFPIIGRIFGMLFMLPALNLLWMMADAWRQGGAIGTQPAELFGLVLWFFFVAVFLVPGWLIATMRRRVTIDRTRRELLQVNDFLIYRWKKLRRLADFSSVRVFIPRRPRSSSSKSRGIVHYHVELVATTGKSVLLYMHEDNDRARAVAQEFAMLTGLPMAGGRAEVQSSKFKVQSSK